jgi:hypothetical protein
VPFLSDRAGSRTAESSAAAFAARLELAAAGRWSDAAAAFESWSTTLRPGPTRRSARDAAADRAAWDGNREFDEENEGGGMKVFLGGARAVFRYRSRKTYERRHISPPARGKRRRR